MIKDEESDWINWYISKMKQEVYNNQITIEHIKNKAMSNKITRETIKIDIN